MAIKKIGYDKINKTVCGITFDTELQAKTHLPGAGARERVLGLEHAVRGRRPLP